MSKLKCQSEIGKTTQERVSSVATYGLFPAKWLLLNIGGGQKMVAISHHDGGLF